MPDDQLTFTIINPEPESTTLSLACLNEECGEEITDANLRRSCGGCGSCCNHNECRQCTRVARQRAANAHTEVILPCFDSDEDEHVCSNCGACEGNHCECSTCSDCGERSGDSNCSDCDECSSCCTCSHCENCSRVMSDSNSNYGCGECSNCDRCCECSTNEEPDVRSTAGAPFHASMKQRSKFNCTRLVGIELEYNEMVNGYDGIRRWYEKWRAGDHEDGSCGREIVTAPIAGDHLVNCMLELQDGIEAAGAKADNKCGIHVHVDASDMGWSDMFRWLKVYAIVEPLLFLIAGQQRINNNYCHPTGSCYAEALKDEDRKGSVLAVALKEAGYPTPAAKSGRAQRRVEKKALGRYKALNIMPWIAGRRIRDRNIYRKVEFIRPNGSYGSKLSHPRVLEYKSQGQRPDCTVEFRLHANSLDAEGRVLQWAKLCARMVDWAAKASDAEASALPKSALRTLCAIAPDMKPWILERIRHWRAATKCAKDSVTAYRRRGDHSGHTGAEGYVNGKLRIVSRRIKLNQGVWQCAV